MPTTKVKIYYFSLVFLLIPPLAYSLSFNLSQIGPQHVNALIKLEGDAYISNQGLHLTPDDRYNALIDKVGRATYFEKLKLWNKVSGNLIDFSTHFSFVVDSGGNRRYADGLAFLLAPVGSSLPPNSQGGALGLQKHQNSSDITINSQPYVAVEFDTYVNYWDPNFVHVGININSLKSVGTALWPIDVSQGVQNDVWITYTASSKNLWVGFNTTLPQGTQYSDNLSYVIDLRDHLPKEVVIGFSGATGNRFEKNNIKSWDFINSTLLLEASPKSAASPPTANATILEKKNQHGLVVTLSVTLPVLVVLAVATYFLWMRCKKVINKIDE